MGWSGIIVGLALGAMALGLVAQVQMAGAEDATSCRAAWAPGGGVLRLRLLDASDAQRAALDVGALDAYLEDRFGVPVLVAGPARVAAGATVPAAREAASAEVIVFLRDAPRIIARDTARGDIPALGAARAGLACVEVAFAPAPPVVCPLQGREVQVQPAYMALAHEVGHVLGLSHAPAGLMAQHARAPCLDDGLDGGEQARVRHAVGA